MMIPEAWENNSADGSGPPGLLCLPLLPDGTVGWAPPEWFSPTAPWWAGCWIATACPGRFWVTEDGLVVLASEAGVLDTAGQDRPEGPLQPGRMFLVDLDQHRIVSDEEIKAQLAAAAPYGEWLIGGRILLSDLPDREHVVHTHASVTRRQQCSATPRRSCG